MNIVLPEFCIVLLVGASGSGKSTFARKYFKEEEILSSDRFRWMITGNEADQNVSKDAFALLYSVLSFRLKRKQRCIIDATNTNPTSRETILLLSKKYNVDVYAFVFNYSFEECNHRNLQRSRVVPAFVIEKQINEIIQYNLRDEKLRKIYSFSDSKEIENLNILTEKMKSNRKELSNLDLIGDIHGCYSELTELLYNLGYKIIFNKNNKSHPYTIMHPENRIPVFLGDLIDRGPKIGKVLELVISLYKNQQALCVMGNHEQKLLKRLNSNEKSSYEIEHTIQSILKISDNLLDETKLFIKELYHHFEFDNGNLVAAHAGLLEYYQGRDSKKVKDFALYGLTNGEKDPNGFPIRKDWTLEYFGSAFIVYGHNPVREPYWQNNTVNIDTGCVFGGKLTALRYPEKEIYSVKAKKIYYPRVSWFK